MREEKRAREKERRRRELPRQAKLKNEPGSGEAVGLNG